MTEMNDTAAQSVVDIVDRLVQAIETADGATLDAVFADHAMIWANFTQVAQPKAHSIAVLLRATEMGALKYTRTEIEVVGNRAILRHHLTITTNAGPVLEIPAALFIDTKDGRITQIFEYVDSAQFMVPSFSEALIP